MKRRVPSLVLASFSETTVSAALRATSPGLASTAFRYVTPFGSTHDAGSTFDLPGPAQRADKLAQPKAAPQKATAKKSGSPSKPGVGLGGRVKPGIPRRYNPLAPERINALLHRLDARYPNVKCALHHNSA